MKAFILSFLVCGLTFYPAQKYIFGAALKKAEYGKTVRTYIGPDDFFSYNTSLVLDLSRMILNDNGSIYNIYDVKKDYYKNGDTKINLKLKANNKSRDLYMGYFVIKNDAFVSSFVLTGPGRRYESYISLISYSK